MQLPLLCARAGFWCCRRHSILTELRVLLVHGLLHLVGFDHEQGEQQLLDMAQQEASLLEQLGWEGSGLISLVSSQDQTSSTASSSSNSDEEAADDTNSSSSSSGSDSSSGSGSSSERASYAGSEGSVSSTSTSSR